MNTTANFQVFPTPFAFSKKKEDCKRYVAQNIGKLINSDKLINNDKILLDKLKRYIIQSTLNVTIDGDVPFSKIDLHDFFSKMIPCVDKSGIIKTDVIRNYIMQMFNEESQDSNI